MACGTPQGERERESSSTVYQLKLWVSAHYIYGLDQSDMDSCMHAHSVLLVSEEIELLIWTVHWVLMSCIFVRCGMESYKTKGCRWCSPGPKVMSGVRPVTRVESFNVPPRGSFLQPDWDLAQEWSTFCGSWHLCQSDVGNGEGLYEGQWAYMWRGVCVCVCDMIWLMSTEGPDACNVTNRLFSTGKISLCLGLSIKKRD